MSLWVSALMCVLFLPAVVLAQDRQAAEGEAIPDDLDEFVYLTYSEGEPVQLESVVRELQREEGLQIYIADSLDEFKESSQVVFYGSETKVRRGETYFQFVQLVLRNNGFALVKDETEALHRIVRLSNVRSLVPFTQDGDDPSKGHYVTGIFSLQHISRQAAENYVRQFAIPRGNRTTGENENDSLITTLSPNLLIVTELSSRVARVKELLARIDTPQSRIKTEFREVNNLEAKALADQLNDILQRENQARASNNEGNENALEDTVTSRNIRNIQISADERTNRIILIGSEAAIAHAEKLISQLDQNVERKVKTFSSSPVSPVEFYKLKHVDAADILDTLQRVVRQTRPDLFGANANGLSTQGFNTGTGLNTIQGLQPNGINAPNQNIGGGITPQNFLSQNPNDPVTRGGLAQSLFQDQGSQTRPQDGGVSEIIGGPLFSSENVLPGEAQITIDQNTNTLIVVAEPAIQELYRELIEKLDVYRPQVLVEVTVVTLTAAEDFSLGIEVSGGDREGAERAFAFSSFGLSEVDAATGGLSLAPGLGFNGTLVDPDIADVILRAISQHSRAKIVTAPRILVNDNATGLLSSVSEVPVTSINASQTVATTSFAGFATAGTTVQITPQISEGDYLNLEFDILVNDFTGAATDSLPPPRSTNQVNSEVSIPNGHTIIVGGLTSRQNSKVDQGIPFLEDIPIFELITGNTIEAESETRLFVFIKPTILKDDKFQDLRYLSEIDHREACIPGDMPQSSPLLIR